MRLGSELTRDRASRACAWPKMFAVGDGNGALRPIPLKTPDPGQRSRVFGTTFLFLCGEFSTCFQVRVPSPEAFNKMQSLELRPHRRILPTGKDRAGLAGWTSGGGVERQRVLAQPRHEAARIGLQPRHLFIGQRLAHHRSLRLVAGTHDFMQQQPLTQDR